MTTRPSTSACAGAAKTDAGGAAATSVPLEGASDLCLPAEWTFGAPVPPELQTSVQVLIAVGNDTRAPALLRAFVQHGHTVRLARIDNLLPPMPHHPAPEIVVVSVPAHDAASDNFLAELKRRGTAKVIVLITSGCSSRDLIETFAQRAGGYVRTTTITVQRDEALWWTWLAGMTTTLCISVGADAIRQA
jgi:hypothetical protein